ncbi:MAG: DUF86 domain-containing protein [Eggerthellaceae bacterium]|jgi:uncharacterized protein with HEPN domain|nr:DUF86 domain-containing protein [Eggerthellaceae bacterium]
MNKTDARILKHIQSEIAIARSLLAGVGFVDFDSNEEKKRAVAMTVINVGELAKHLSDEFFDSFAAADLKYAAKTRDVYAHGYATLSFPMVYKTATESFLKLEALIQEILKTDSSTSEATTEPPDPSLRA